MYDKAILNINESMRKIILIRGGAGQVSTALTDLQSEGSAVISLNGQTCVLSGIGLILTLIKSDFVK
jgi:hypothetical protein